MARTPAPADASAPAKATIDDVAKLAGVSKATVSRVLNRRDELLTAEIAGRVRAAIAQLGYAPSPMAQALKRGRSRLIGLVVADVANPFSVAVLRGAERACRAAGYLVMLFNLGDDGVGERDAIQALASYQVEGFILHTLGRDPRALEAAARNGKPAVMVDRRQGDAALDLVGLDNTGAVRMAGAHLLEAGYRELLLVSEAVRGVGSREERAWAFRGFLAEHAAVCRGDAFESMAGGEQALDDALRALKARAGSDPPAVLAANAVVTLRVAAAAARLGLRLGTDLGLVAFDDPDWAALVGPGISTIALPTDEIGRLAARCLIERLEGESGPPRQILLAGRLLRRGSSQPGT